MNDVTSLVAEECEACKAGAPKVSDNDIGELLQQLPDWQLLEKDGIKMLYKEYSFKDFASALAFTNRVGILAEALQHHPDILTSWGKVALTWYTHKIGGLHRNDFRCAARSDLLLT